MARDQSHLGYIDTVNYGSYYTPEKIVSVVYDMLYKNIKKISDFTIVDTSCGYGNFLIYPDSVGADCDNIALKEAKKNANNCRFFHHNSLKNVGRAQYKLDNSKKIIIVGNPPYNDKTSIIRNEIKHENYDMDDDIKHRDLGISFLLSYNKLAADYICILHPLSYLIKKTNFSSLGDFKNNYSLTDSVIISSGEFSETSRSTHFPIIIALYKRGECMTHNSICGYRFRTKDGRQFKINQFDYLNGYISKYPNQKSVPLEQTVAYFWTMRDINALKRSRTFIENEVYNSIRVQRDKLAFYCYADVFKEYIPRIPYYFGNSDIMIDCQAFDRIKNIFIKRSLSKYSFLQKLSIDYKKNNTQDDGQIHSYFRNLLGEHYDDTKN